MIPDPKKSNLREWPPAGKFSAGVVAIDYDHTGFTVTLKGEMVSNLKKKKKNRLETLFRTIV